MAIFVNKEALIYDKWLIKDPKSNRLLDRIFESRGITHKSEKEFFLKDYQLSDLHDPWQLKDIEKAVNRIKLAILNQERIMVLGDYDVDGTTGTAVLFQALKKLGAEVSYRVPHREIDGYGIKEKHINELKELNVKLIITTDNGISAAEEIELANKLSIDVIITDHHQVSENIPGALAVINPKQSDCNYQNSDISGAVVSAKLAQAVIDKMKGAEEAYKFILEISPLLAIATIADCMVLTGENRVIVSIGLKQMSKTNNPALKELIRVSNLNPDKVSSEDIAFQLAPRLNASGRMDNAYHSIAVLLGNLEKVKVLDALNIERRKIIRESLEKLENKEFDKQVIILNSENWSKGIIGLIAGRLTEKHHLPSIILNEKGDKMSASCRAPDGFDLYEFLKNLSEYFISFGGHAQAAGFSMQKEKFSEFKKKAEQKSKEILKTQRLEKALKVDCEISLSDLKYENYLEISRLEPFGIMNPKPCFILKNIQRFHFESMGKEKNHLRGHIWINDNEKIKVVKFFAADLIDELAKNKNWDFVVSLEANSWQGKMSLELRLIDARKSKLS